MGLIRTFNLSVAKLPQTIPCPHHKENVSAELQYRPSKITVKMGEDLNILVMDLPAYYCPICEKAGTECEFTTTESDTIAVELINHVKYSLKNNAG